MDYDKATDTFRFVSFDKRCNLHKNINGQGLVTAIFAHERSFTQMHGKHPTDTQQLDIEKKSKAEIIRIRKLP